MFPKYFVIGAINAALSIALGAFGAHGLEDKVSEHLIEVFETGARYHMYGALGLMLISLLAKIIDGGKLLLNGARFIFAGIILFSGSLYVMTLTDISKLGMITPLGGVAMLIGWVCVIISAIKFGRK